MAERTQEIRPQAGPQTLFLSTPADVAIYGGAGGGGKSYALLLDPLRHYSNPLFGAVIFRRTTKQVRNEGGLWDEATRLYSPLGARLLESTLECIFRTGMRVTFAHLEHEKNIYDYQGSQIPLIGFDELTHFTERQFWYMLSRNRSTSGVPGYIRATCNADAESWVRVLVDWWIDSKSGYPIAERAGVLRYFLRRDDKLHWADTKEELAGKFQVPLDLVKSLTFIPAKLEDNPILMTKDPGYRANLEALPYVERMQLLEGNWNIKPKAGNFFKRGWFSVVDAIPQAVTSLRYWDRAATDATSKNPDPAYTAGIKIIRDSQGRFTIADISRFRGSPHVVEQTILNYAQQDGLGTQVWLEQDPGQAGVMEIKHYSRVLAGFDIRFNKVTKDKVTRAKPASAQAEAGNIQILRAAWNEDFLKEVEGFPEAKKKDQVDALSGAIFAMTIGQAGQFTSKMVESNAQSIAGSDHTPTDW